MAAGPMENKWTMSSDPNRLMNGICIFSISIMVFISLMVLVIYAQMTTGKVSGGWNSIFIVVGILIFGTVSFSLIIFKINQQLEKIKTEKKVVK